MSRNVHFEKDASPPAARAVDLRPDDLIVESPQASIRLPIRGVMLQRLDDALARVQAAGHKRPSREDLVGMLLLELDGDSDDLYARLRAYRTTRIASLTVGDATITELPVRRKRGRPKGT